MTNATRRIEFHRTNDTLKPTMTEPTMTEPTMNEPTMNEPTVPQPTTADSQRLQLTDDLVARCIDGRATADDVRILEERLAGDVDFRRAWLRIANLDAAIHGLVDGGLCDPRDSNPVEGPRSAMAVAAGGRSPRHRFPYAAGLLAAGVGLFAGLGGVTLVWATVGPRAAMVHRVIADSFETGRQPEVTGIPLEPGFWSGDYAEFAAESGRVRPRSGTKMLRFLRSDFEGKASKSGHASNVYRLIDLRPFRTSSQQDDVTVRVLAHFNVDPGARMAGDKCNVAAYAIEGAALHGGLRGPEAIKSLALSYAFCQHIDLDDDSATWQAAVTELRLPPTTDFLMVHVGVTRKQVDGETIFAGHSCDDVHVSLVHRPDLP